MIAYCPERVLPGNLLKELASNERVVGALTLDLRILHLIFIKML